MPRLNFAPYFTFGRLRPLHTNAVIFAFAGNASSPASTTRRSACSRRGCSDRLSRIHFWGWQAIIVAAAITLPLGFTQGKEYAELEWPIDIAIAVVWVVVRRELLRDARASAARSTSTSRSGSTSRRSSRSRSCTSSTTSSIPVGPVQELLDLRRRAGRVHAVVVRPQRRRVLPDDAVPRPHVLLPAEGGRAAGVFSYRLSILHFWSLVFIYIWAGPAPPALHGAAASGRRRSA